ncbi:MAG TPA: GNAT family N-acetyltransferase [Acidocella sp.]|jgi:RimJ/RimL family protein N-acetyltransferase|uniref:GNAT family N-acetyltransferase n=1 Tax=Acidocella sp. TaxID=50710 RepID=UPI002C34CC71|nr:GNAT family N-acetyltransferase [Acidocella sp.]HVE20809.1 GNAT family N-acetyltransferase [Acidocella sp.]
MIGLSPWNLTTARLRMTPVGYRDLPDLTALKGDPRAYALMLGGVRGPVQVAEELAQEIRDWGAHGYGMWAVRALRGRFLGVTGLMARADGRGVALRFAFWPEARGVGLAREAAGAALNYAHDSAGLARVVAVAREDNFASRTVLGSIGMAEVERFTRDGVLLLVYQSIRRHAGG